MRQSTVIRCSRGTTSKKSEYRHHNQSRGTGRTMRTLAPKACGGKLDLNFDFTTPLLPCGRVTRLQDHKRWCNVWRRTTPYPQITRTFDPAICRLARYTYATRCANATIQHGESRGIVCKSRHLSEVELCVLLCRNALDLKKGSVGTSITFAALMAKHAPFAVESVGETRVRFGCSLRDLIRWAWRPERRHPDPAESIHHLPGYPHPHPPCSR